MAHTPTSIGSTLKRRRKSLRMSQAILARRAKVDPGHLSRIERGIRNPSLAILGRLLDALGLVFVAREPFDWR